LSLKHAGLSISLQQAFLDSCKASQQGSSGGGGGFKFPWDK
jgi:hypothetical protein